MTHQITPTSPDWIPLLRATFTYDPATGLLHRDGRPAAKPTASGPKVTICRQSFGVHLIAWALTTGEWPTSYIDHKDGDRANNRWENLVQTDQPTREVWNHGLTKANKSGVRGVSWSKVSNKWQATISLDGVRRHLGFFDDLTEAKVVRSDAEMRLRGYKKPAAGVA